MLGDHAAVATVAVSDLERARDFYEQTLGLSIVREVPGAIFYRTGDTELLVYPEMPHAGIGMPSVLERWFPRLIDFLRRAMQR